MARKSEVEDNISRMHQLRNKVAHVTQRLSEMDRSRRALRVNLERSFRFGPVNESTGKQYSEAACKDMAATDKQYVAVLAEIDAVTLERDLAAAEAEAAAYTVQLQVAERKAPAFS